MLAAGIARALADLFFPQVCVVCRHGGEGLLCPSCLRTFPLIAPPVCAKCGRPVPPTGRGDVCGASRCRQFPFARARSAAVYEGPMRRTILALKFGRQPRLAAPLGELMAEVAARDPLVAAAQMVVPVPLHASRLRERGFNQADLLARPVARRLDVPLRPDLIRKVRDTPPQSTLQAGGRHTNVAGSFAPSAPLTPISVVLIDDVFSTGTTVSECARVLLTAGASHVSVLTAAAALLVDSPYSCQGRARHGG